MPIMILAAIGVIFLGPVLGAFLGSLIGWIVGLFFGDTILHVLQALTGAEGVAMWQFGTFLGFVGGFMKTTTAKT